MSYLTIQLTGINQSSHFSVQSLFVTCVHWKHSALSVFHERRPNEQLSRENVLGFFPATWWMHSTRGLTRHRLGKGGDGQRRIWGEGQGGHGPPGQGCITKSMKCPIKKQTLGTKGQQCRLGPPPPHHLTFCKWYFSVFALYFFCLKELANWTFSAFCQVAVGSCNLCFLHPVTQIMAHRNTGHVTKNKNWVRNMGNRKSFCITSCVHFFGTK